MMQIDNHWNYGKEYRDHMSEGYDYEPEPPHWKDCQWTQHEHVDTITGTEFWIVRSDKLEGLGTYENERLINVEDIHWLWKANTLRDSSRLR